MKTNLFLRFGMPVGARMRTGEFPSPRLYTLSTIDLLWFFSSRGTPISGSGDVAAVQNRAGEMPSQLPSQQHGKTEKAVSHGSWCKRLPFS